ncbi:MAG TPA: phosphoribosylaminoimidazole carboxylase, partial [Thermotoga neapolitana]|nr:phosphoribosylaminoimidazole carboxylase [Thermotoga neapolitana]
MFEDVLRSLASGEITIQEAEEKILSKFFERTNELMLDMERDKRQGFPEIVFALGKTKEQTIAAVEKFLERKGIAFVSGLDEEKKRELKDRFFGYVIKEAGRLVVLKRENTTLEKLNGKVGVITAGTSDVPFAEETSLILEELGVNVQKVYDAGVAGIHRSFYALSKTEDSDLLIV